MLKKIFKLNIFYKNTLGSWFETNETNETKKISVDEDRKTEGIMKKFLPKAPNDEVQEYTSQVENNITQASKEMKKIAITEFKPPLKKMESEIRPNPESNESNETSPSENIKKQTQEALLNIANMKKPETKTWSEEVGNMDENDIDVENSEFDPDWLSPEEIQHITSTLDEHFANMPDGDGSLWDAESAPEPTSSPAEEKPTTEAGSREMELDDVIPQ